MSGGSGTPSITQRDKRFVPHVVAVQRGEAVSFPNLDPIFHNVFSVSAGNEFDLGLFRKGAARSVRFRSAGLVRVYCNIHPEMAAYVRVLDASGYRDEPHKNKYGLDYLVVKRNVNRY